MPPCPHVFQFSVTWYNHLGVYITVRVSIKCKTDELRKKVLPQLRDTVFHVTSARNYEGILNDQRIEPNINGRFPYTFPQSEKSYGAKRGYICLFDLRNKADAVIDEGLRKFYFLNPNSAQNVPVFLVLSPELYSNLIDCSVARAEVGPKETWIPDVECWYPNSIPLEHIDKTIYVTVEREPASV